MNTEYQQRFAGTARLYGASALEYFCNLKVTVVGVGGVGSWAVEALARTGVGCIRLIDLDEICVSNINRQLPAVTNTIGMSKVSILADRLKQINPDIQVEPVFDFMTEKNLDEWLLDTDAVVDAIDSVKVKAAIIAWCKRQKTPIVTTGAAGGQLDPTMIGVTDLNKTFNDPLAKKVRTYLRRHYGFSRTASRSYSVPCVFSKEPLRYPAADGQVSFSKPKYAVTPGKLNCSGGFGACAMVTGTFGFVAVSRLLEKLLAKHQLNQALTQSNISKL